LSVVDYAPTIEGKLNPKLLPEGGAPALHFTISTAMMGQHLESWLLADDPQHGNFGMGLANVELKRGVAATDANSITSKNPNKNEAIDLEESIFSFSKAPDQQIGPRAERRQQWGKVQLLMPENGNKGRLVVSLGGKQTSVDVAENLGKDVAVPGTAFALKIDNYWPDFRIEDGKPGSLSEQPNNPAVLVTIRGRGTPAAAPPSPHGASGGELSTNGGPPTMPEAGAEFRIISRSLSLPKAPSPTNLFRERTANPAASSLSMNRSPPDGPIGSSPSIR